MAVKAPSVLNSRKDTVKHTRVRVSMAVTIISKQTRMQRKGRRIKQWRRRGQLRQMGKVHEEQIDS